MTGSYQGFSTSYTGLPESTSTFTLDLLGGSQQLTEKSPIFGKCCSHFALNIYHIYFNWIFHTHGDRFFKKFAVGAPTTTNHTIRIFQAFRICINFYPTSKDEVARLNLLPEHLGARFRAFCQISWVAEWTVWGVCQFFARNQCPRPFYHKESTKLHRHSYQKPLLLLTYLIPYVNASSWKTQLI